MLISFVLMGKWLEARAKGKTSDAIRALAALQPTTARIVEMGTEMAARAAAFANRAADDRRRVSSRRDDDVANFSTVSTEIIDVYSLARRSFGNDQDAARSFLQFATEICDAAAAPNGERTVGAALLQRGDVLRVAPGARFPADGRVLFGENVSADESALTGESMPVSKRVGDFVIGGYG